MTLRKISSTVDALRETQGDRKEKGETGVVVPGQNQPDSKKQKGETGAPVLRQAQHDKNQLFRRAA